MRTEDHKKWGFKEKEKGGGPQAVRLRSEEGEEGMRPLVGTTLFMWFLIVGGAAYMDGYAKFAP